MRVLCRSVSDRGEQRRARVKSERDFRKEFSELGPQGVGGVLERDPVTAVQ